MISGTLSEILASGKSTIVGKPGKGVSSDDKVRRLRGTCTQLSAQTKLVA